MQARSVFSRRYAEECAGGVALADCSASRLVDSAHGTIDPGRHVRQSYSRRPYIRHRRSRTPWREDLLGYIGRIVLVETGSADKTEAAFLRLVSFTLIPPHYRHCPW